MVNNIIDAPIEKDIFLDNIHDKLMELTGTDIINRIKISAKFDEKIDGDDYYIYIINGNSMTFAEAYNILISK